MSRIMITISGPVGVGKSAVAYRIKKALDGLPVGMSFQSDIEYYGDYEITATDIDIVERVDYAIAQSLFAPRYKKYAAWPVVFWCRLRGHIGQPAWGGTNRCLRCGDAR